MPVDVLVFVKSGLSCRSAQATPVKYSGDASGPVLNHSVSNH